MTTSNYKALAEDEKRAILLANSYPRVFEEDSATLHEIEIYAKALNALDKNFGERFSKTFAVHNFRKLKQDPGQSIQQFVAMLKPAANESNFVTTVDNEI